MSSIFFDTKKILINHLGFLSTEEEIELAYFLYDLVMSKDKQFEIDPIHSLEEVRKQEFVYEDFGYKTSLNNPLQSVNHSKIHRLPQECR